MEAMKIGIDMDEVLSESLDFIFEQIGFEFHGVKLDRNLVKSYNDVFDCESNGIDFKEAIKVYIGSMKKDIKRLEIKPVDGAIEKVKELKAKGYKLFIITARNSDFFFDYTFEWINKYFPNIFEEIIFVDHFTDKHREKSEVCFNYGITLMVEDNLDYALELSKKGIKTIVLEKPWNSYRKEFNDNIIRVLNWYGVEV